VIAPDVLLRNEICGEQRLGMFRIVCWKQFSSKCQGARVAASRFGTACREAADQEGLAPFSEVARIIGLFRYLPSAGQADPIRMKQTSEPLFVRPPAQIGFRID